MLSKKKMRIVLVVIAIVMIALIGGNRMSIIKEVGQIRESIAQKFPSEEEKRRRIALWVVQHYDVPEPIKEIRVSKIKSYGLLGTGGRAVSVIINDNEKYIIDGISVERDGTPRGIAIYGDDVTSISNSKKTLEGIKVEFWEE
ncbi:hypothetical protein [Ligilactobacillus murinus]|jgi:hypothetical protein|uniref:Uncharacterized protein n=1 Tax=Ligilactobacillus murinus TaxID=1622 RepID=A0A4Q2AVV7_9LACO|nr:hypothetical protein [Ligilactobacillus murinus]NBH85678.1 hypothetical protein [Lachnospiraceae bacterium]MBF0700959.1 hypothetical protein [Ligilactobacillus murinus]MCR1880623.1 hypothetical protein [Ligilactobacillus murinus]MCZ0673711.1 hypothetical protein [Ligilactobacillus murinus]MCZ0694625.1 hypothetical protein [Ligilactobacillus murinus]